jgi:hypothetical protein
MPPALKKAPKLENAGVFGDRIAPPSCGLASFFALFLQISQKLHDFWLMLRRQYLPYCSAFHFHTMQLIRNGQSCCSVQKTLVTVVQPLIALS